MQQLVLQRGSKVVAHPDPDIFWSYTDVRTRPGFYTVDTYIIKFLTVLSKTENPTLFANFDKKKILKSNLDRNRPLKEHKF
jgi:hypothetical protein